MAEPRHDLPPPAELARALVPRVLDVCRYYLPKGTQSGGYWHVGDVSGEPGQSLYVHLNGPAAGRWADAATGDRGDLLDLIQQNRNHASLGDAMKEARAFLGGSFEIPPEAPAQRDNVVRTGAGNVEAYQRAFDRAQLVSPDNPGGVHLSRERGLDLDLAGEVLRYTPEWTVMIDDELERRPAVLAPIRTHDGRLEAIHRIYIKPDGSPADFDRRKRNSGRLDTGAVWFGVSEPTHVILMEGVEDALAVYRELSDTGRARCAVAATTSAGRMHRVEMPPSATEISLVMDLDAAGGMSWHNLERRWEGTDVETRLVVLRNGKDPSEILTRKGGGREMLRRNLDKLGTDIEGGRPVARRAPPAPAPDAPPPARTERELHQRIGGESLLSLFVRDALAEEMRSLGVTGASVRVVDDLPASVRGEHLAGVVRLALADRDTMRAALRHEVIHALRDIGALSGRPWRILERFARREWMHLLADRYVHLTERERIEEAVAEAYRLWFEGRLEVEPQPRSVFQRIAAAVRRIRNWCLGHRWPRAEAVFEAIEAGRFTGVVGRPDVRDKPDVEVQAVELKWRDKGLKAAQRAARRWAAANIAGDHVNEDTGWTISVGAREAASGSPLPERSRANIEAMQALPGMLRTAVRYESGPPKLKSRRTRGVKSYHLLMAAVSMGGEPRPVQLLVREMRDGGLHLDRLSVSSTAPQHHGWRRQDADAGQEPVRPARSVPTEALFDGVSYRNDGPPVLETLAGRPARRMLEPAPQDGPLLAEAWIADKEAMIDEAERRCTHFYLLDEHREIVARARQLAPRDDLPAAARREVEGHLEIDSRLDETRRRVERAGRALDKAVARRRDLLAQAGEPPGGGGVFQADGYDTWRELAKDAVDTWRAADSARLAPIVMTSIGIGRETEMLTAANKLEAVLSADAAAMAQLGIDASAGVRAQVREPAPATPAPPTEQSDAVLAAARAAEAARSEISAAARSMDIHPVSHDLYQGWRTGAQDALDECHRMMDRTKGTQTHHTIAAAAARIQAALRQDDRVIDGERGRAVVRATPPADGPPPRPAAPRKASGQSLSA